MASLYPEVSDASDGVPYELGMKFEATRSGSIVAIRYWKCEGDSVQHVGRIWSTDGMALTSATFMAESGQGWQEQALASLLRIMPNVTYIVTVNSGARYPFTPDGLRKPIVSGNLRSVADGLNGLLGHVGSFPNNSIQNCNYFRDIVFVADALGAPVRLAITPAHATTSMGTPVTLTASAQDSGGNPVVADGLVHFSVTGVPGSFTTPRSVSMQDGRAAISFTPTSAGTAAVTAASSGLVSGTATLHVTA